MQDDAKLRRHRKQDKTDCALYVIRRIPGLYVIISRVFGIPVNPMSSTNSTVLSSSYKRLYSVPLKYFRAVYAFIRFSFSLLPSIFVRISPKPWDFLLLFSFSLSRRGWWELPSKWRHNFAWSNFQCNPHLVYHFDGIMEKAITLYDALLCLWAALVTDSLDKHDLAWGSTVHFIAGGSS
jgi:hypothetical protein